MKRCKKCSFYFFYCRVPSHIHINLLISPSNKKNDDVSKKNCQLILQNELLIVTKARN